MTPRNRFFSSSFFFQKSRKVPEVADLSISCGWGVVKVGEVGEFIARTSGSAVAQS